MDTQIIVMTIITMKAKIFPQRNSHRLTGLLKNHDNEPFFLSLTIELAPTLILKMSPKYKMKILKNILIKSLIPSKAIEPTNLFINKKEEKSNITAATLVRAKM